ncbi:hypothetical protein CK203_099973 [Vitis vinifera]|uniref:Uncharacterized protein n=1 Tax=Vitis vinifera TaxID=29760 RepID=A0A438CIT5_VITVI|nr:hypothetical protein CK203_099973 [Vitis vinifera]
MEIELEPRVKTLSYKIKASSRESPSQKAIHVLDTDLRTHWSTSTNTKEWILLELDVRSSHFLFGWNLAYYHTYGYIISLFLNGKLQLACGTRELSPYLCLIIVLPRLSSGGLRPFCSRAYGLFIRGLGLLEKNDRKSNSTSRKLYNRIQDIINGLPEELEPETLPLVFIEIANAAFMYGGLYCMIGIEKIITYILVTDFLYQPETFVKVRPRCEAPRRDMIYPVNYTPCRYVRISCLRGNPISIFFIQLIGISVTGLEPEFQPVVSHLLPQIISNKQDANDMHLQLLQDITNRLLVFLPQLEGDLTSFPDAPEPSIRFLAMLAGPFYPILHIANERETARALGNISDSEASKNCQPTSALTVSSNFENWRFAIEREALWNQVIRGKYGEDRGGWCFWEVREAHGMGLWKGIRMDWELVSDRMVFIVGNGRRVRFWRDRWCGDSPLCVSFPSLFALTVDKEAWVADIWEAEGGWGCWNSCFSRAFNDWEVEEAERFLERLHGKRVLEDVEDMVSWTETKSGKFSVNSLYFALEAGCPSLFPSSYIWNPRRSRSTSPFVLPTSSAVVFRPDAIFVLLRKAYKDSDLGTVCRMASRILQKLTEPAAVPEASIPSTEITSSVLDETPKTELSNLVLLVDYSNLFGEDFQIPDDHWDLSYLNILDIGAVEEGIYMFFLLVQLSLTCAVNWQMILLTFGLRYACTSIAARFITI